MLTDSNETDHIARAHLTTNMQLDSLESDNKEGGWVKITGCRLIITLVTTAFVSSKAVLSYQGQSVAPTTLERVFRVVLTLGLVPQNTFVSFSTDKKFQDVLARNCERELTRSLAAALLQGLLTFISTWSSDHAHCDRLKPLKFLRQLKIMTSLNRWLDLYYCIRPDSCFHTRDSCYSIGPCQRAKETHSKLQSVINKDVWTKLMTYNVILLQLSVFFISRVQYMACAT